MNPERLQFKGQLAESRKKYKNLDIEASGLIILIRSFLNPYEEDVTKLQTDKALNSMQRLNEVRELMLNLKSRIEKMEEDLE